METMEIRVTAITTAKGDGVKPGDIKAIHVGCKGEINILDPGIHFVYDVSCKRCGITARVERDKLLSAATREGTSRVGAKHILIPHGRLDVVGRIPSSR